MSNVTLNPSSVPTVADWTYQTSAMVDDNSWAVLTNNATTKIFLAGYGGAIPAGATINGIVIYAKISNCGHTGGGWPLPAPPNICSLRIGLTKDGVNVTPTTFRENVTSSYVIDGSSTELWGDTWTPAEINDANFGAVLYKAVGEANEVNGTVSIDNVYIVVYYTVPTYDYIIAASNLTCAPTLTLTDEAALVLSDATGGCSGTVHLDWTG